MSELLKIKRRDQISIMIDLLGVLVKPIRITRLIRLMNLNYVYLIRYLKRIDELGLIIYDKKEYSLSEKGKEFYKLLQH